MQRHSPLNTCVCIHVVCGCIHVVCGCIHVVYVCIQHKQQQSPLNTCVCMCTHIFGVCGGRVVFPAGSGAVGAGLAFPRPSVVH